VARRGERRVPRQLHSQRGAIQSGEHAMTPRPGRSFCVALRRRFTSASLQRRAQAGGNRSAAQALQNLSSSSHRRCPAAVRMRAVRIVGQGNLEIGRPFAKKPPFTRATPESYASERGILLGAILSAAHESGVPGRRESTQRADS
jgi:hypothetical protein